MAAPPPNPVSDAQVRLFRETVVALVRRDSAELSARQLGVFLTCYLNDDATYGSWPRRRAERVKAAITRARDRAGVLVQRTTKGAAFLREIRGIMTEASSEGKKTTKKAAA